MKMQKAPATVFTFSGQVAMMRLPPKHRFVMVGTGSPPKAITNITEPAVYKIDISSIAAGSEWPIIVFVVKTKHVPMFERMTPEQASAMVRAAQHSVQHGGIVEAFRAPTTH